MIQTTEELQSAKEKLMKWKEKGLRQTIEILTVLKKSNLTSQQLQETKIPKIVTTLSKLQKSQFTEDEQSFISQIIEESDKLITRWKKLFKKITQPTSQKTEKQPKQSKDKTIAQQQGIDLEFNPMEQATFSDQKKAQYKNDTRNKGLQGLINTFIRDLEKEIQEENLTKIYDLCYLIEKEVFTKQYESNLEKKHDKLKQFYQDDIKTICQYLNKKSTGRELKDRILNGDLTPQQVATCNCDYFMSNEHKQQMQLKMQKEIQASKANFYADLRKKDLKNVEGEVCRGCKQKTAFCEKELQTRSADEPMTRFMACNSCDKQWKD